MVVFKENQCENNTQAKTMNLRSIKGSSTKEVLFILLFTQCILCVKGQEDITIDASDEGLVYLLLVLFLGFNYCTPVALWIYRNYLIAVVEKITKKVEKVKKRISDKITDASRKHSQSLRNSMGMSSKDSGSMSSGGKSSTTKK